MTPEQRSKLIRRLCLFGPLLSAASIALLAFAPVRGLFLLTSQKISPGLASFASVAPALGWVVLTLGCAVGSCLDRVRQKGATGWALAFRLSLFIPLVFAAQVIVCTGIAVGGCMLVVGMPH